MKKAILLSLFLTAFISKVSASALPYPSPPADPRSINWVTFYLTLTFISVLIGLAIFGIVFFYIKLLKQRYNETNRQVPLQASKILDSINMANFSIGLLSFVLVVTVIVLSHYHPVGNIGFGGMIALYALVIFSPAAIVKIKQGWRSFFSVLIMGLLLFIIFSTILFSSFIASEEFYLYLSSTFITVLIVSIAIVLMGLLKKYRKQKEQIEEQAFPKISKDTRIFNLTNALAGLFSFLLTVFLTFLWWLLDFYLFPPGLSGGLIFVIFLIMIILSYILTIFGPAVIIAVKHGWKSFISVLIIEFLLFVIFLTVFTSLYHSTWYPPFTSPFIYYL